MRSVVVDANVLISFFVARNAKQHDAADELLQRAERGDIVAIVPQFVVFETAYVLQSQYAITGDQLASVIRDVVTAPGVQAIDTCPWPRIFELWPKPVPGLADASLIAVVLTHRYDAIATFDQKLGRRAKDLGVVSLVTASRTNSVRTPDGKRCRCPSPRLRGERGRRPGEGECHRVIRALSPAARQPRCVSTLTLCQRAVTLHSCSNDRASNVLPPATSSPSSCWKSFG